MDNKLTQEWITLQNQSDSYEKYSLIIKLFALMLCFIANMGSLSAVDLIVFILLAWSIDSVWKTFHSRIESRLFIIEAAINSPTDQGEDPTCPCRAFQYNTQFAANRPSTVQLIGQYARQGIKPTVAFVYVILLIHAMTKLG